MFSKKETIRKIVLILSIIGLILCITLLFPQVRVGIVSFLEQMMHRKLYSPSAWVAVISSFAIGGICFLIFINYCIQTNSGRKLVSSTKEEVKVCLSEIDFRSFIKPSLWMFVVYSLGILTIIRANFYYDDDFFRAVLGTRGFNYFNRYVAEILSIFIHANFKLTDISPLPQLLAALMLAVSSVLLVYILCNKKITVISLLASIPLGLSPFFLECLSYKYDAPYMALSVLASIFPFIFMNRKRAFLFFSVISLLIMFMTYQAASGVYLMIVLILCFQDWNTQRKTNKEILSFAGTSLFAYVLVMLIFKFFIMKPPVKIYVSSEMLPINQLIPGLLLNIKIYIHFIISVLSLVWIICIALVVIFFLFKSVQVSSQKKLIALMLSFFVICLSFLLSYGIYYMLKHQVLALRLTYGFGVWLAILCVYITYNYSKIAKIAALALCWSFFVFAFSYGNALADQMRYTNFRVGLLMHDLSTLFPEENKVSIQFDKTIDYTPSVKLLAEKYPVTAWLRVKMYEKTWQYIYFMDYFNFGQMQNQKYTEDTLDYDTLDLPVVLDTYYHTIKSDGEHVLVVLKH